MTDTPIENLAFEGGGAKGAAYAGAVDALDELGHYEGVKRLAGTSAGSMTAAILATGGGSAGLQHVVDTTNFEAFVSDRWGKIGDAYRLWNKYGIHTADGFVKILKAVFKENSGNADLTFGQLRTQTRKDSKKFKELFVVTSNVTQQKRQVFDATSSPDTPIWLAVRASMSIPVLFEPVEINGDLFVDGGMAWNYPVNMFDTEKPDTVHGGTTWVRNDKTLGFYLQPSDTFATGPKLRHGPDHVGSLKDYGLALMDYFFDAGNADELHPGDKARTIFIDDLGVSTTDFSLSGKRLAALVESGRTATEMYFADRAKD